MEVNGQLIAPGKEPLGAHWTKDWVGPTAGLDAVKKITSALAENRIL
jgi:hypothetical protein